MNAQDLEQRAREVEWATRSLRELWEQSNKGWEAQGAVRQLESFIAAALRQQPAPAIIDNAGKVECAEPVAYPERWRLDDRELNAGRLKALHRGLELARKWSRGTGTHGHTDRMVRDMADELRRGLSSQDGDYDHQPAPVVDDAMVERAAVALSNFDRPHPNPEAFWAYRSEESREKYRGRVRAALTAALARAQGVQS